MDTRTAFIAIALFAAPLAAQDSTKVAPAKIAGSWDLSFTSPQGAATWRANFEQSVDTLWGTVATGDFGNLNVTDGWVAGNDVSFSVALNFSGQSIALNFTGAVKGDTINGQIDVPGVGVPPFAFTGIKVTGSDSRFASGSRMPAERPRLVSIRTR